MIGPRPASFADPSLRRPAGPHVTPFLGIVTSPACSDRGSMLPLLAFFTFLALTVTFLVAAATSLYIERERLFTVADAAALAAAESFALDDVAVDGSTVSARLGAAGVRDRAGRYLAALPVGMTGARLRAVTLVAASTDGDVATIRLSARWDPPVVSALVPRGFALTVTSRAAPRFG